MTNARTKRSGQRLEALQYLVEAVLDRSDARSAAIVGIENGQARIVAGPVARGEECAELDAVTEGTDLLTRAVAAGGKTYYLAALGTRVRKMTDAARAITRIVATTEA